MLWGCFGCLISREMSLKFCLKLDKRSLPEKMNQVWWMGKDGMRRKGRGFWFLQFNIVEVIIFNINTFTFQFLKETTVDWENEVDLEKWKSVDWQTSKQQMTLVQTMQQKEVSCQQMVSPISRDQTPQGVQKQRNCHNSQRMKVCNHTFVWKLCTLMHVGTSHPDFRALQWQKKDAGLKTSHFATWHSTHCLWLHDGENSHSLIIGPSTGRLWKTEGFNGFRVLKIACWVRISGALKNK